MSLAASSVEITLNWAVFAKNLLQATRAGIVEWRGPIPSPWACNGRVRVPPSAWSNQMFRDASLRRRVWVFAGLMLAVVTASSASLRKQVPRTEEWNGRKIGIVQDWSTRYAVFRRDGSSASMAAIRQEPRAFMAWRAAQAAQERAGQLLLNERFAPLVRDGIRIRRDSGLRRGSPTDWSINLTGSGTVVNGTADGMYPAKFTFDINAAPSCSTDFVVFPVNQTPGTAQENLVAFNNLYSGTAGADGACNRTASGSDTGTAATVTWSYAVGAGGVATSPTLSLDGNKVAFVESSAGQAHFHVLGWRNGDGVNAADLQSPLSPVVISSFTTFAPAEGSGTATDLVFSSNTDTLSSPYVDYVNDVAYVGDDQGHLFRIINVFCTANPLCSTGTPPAPSVDTTYGATGTVTVGPGSCNGTATSKLTGPVEDATTGNVFVGCADGKLYGFSSGGAALSGRAVTVGDGSATGGLVDPPIVDGSDGFVYAFTGNNGSANAVVVQAQTTNLNTVGNESLGVSGVAPLHSGAFNDAYFSSLTSTTWALYAQGYATAATSTLYAFTFSSSRILNGTLDTHNTTTLNPVSECSPATEILNGATDWLFYSCFAAHTLDNFKITTFPTGGRTKGVTATGGTSAIIADNVSSVAQASSIYFSTLGSGACGVGGTGFCAVKLTQSELQ